jgi:aldehyde oxidoreductase
MWAREAEGGKRRKSVICTSAACMGQGIATVVLQIVARPRARRNLCSRCTRRTPMVTPDSGTSTASRQTTGHRRSGARAATRSSRICAIASLAELEGEEFYGEYDCVTDPMTSTSRIA